MDIEVAQLKIFYNWPYDDEMNRCFEEELKELLYKYQWVDWASGFDLTTNVRDLNFEKNNVDIKEK